MFEGHHATMARAFALRTAAPALMPRIHRHYYSAPRRVPRAPRRFRAVAEAESALMKVRLEEAERKVGLYKLNSVYPWLESRLVPTLASAK